MWNSSYWDKESGKLGEMFKMQSWQDLETNWVWEKGRKGPCGMQNDFHVSALLLCTIAQEQSKEKEGGFEDDI